MDKPALTIKETAKEFQFPEYAIRTLVKRGAFPVVQVFEEYLKKGGAAYEPEQHSFTIQQRVRR